MDARELCAESCRTSQVCSCFLTYLIIIVIILQDMQATFAQWGLCLGLITCQAWALNCCTFHTGVQSVDIDLAQQKVVVKGDISQDDILQTVSKTGKKTELWQ